MKSASALMLFLALFGQTPDWERTDGGMLLTSASLWKVNSAEKLTASQALVHFANANISTHKIDTTIKHLVFDQLKVNTKDRAFLELPYDEDKGEYLLEEEKFIEKLRDLELALPEGPLGFLPRLDVDRLTSTQLQKWFLLKQSLYKEGEDRDGDTDGVLQSVPVMQSVLLEWGPREKVNAEKEKLIDSEEGEISESKIYDRHYVKIPLELEIFSSNLGDSGPDASSRKPIQGLYLIRHINQESGYLWYKPPTQGIGRILLLEVPKFSKSYGSFQIPAQCFINYVAATRLPYEDLSCLLPRKSNVQSACQKVTERTSEGETRERLMLVGAFGESKSTKEVQSAEFWLKRSNNLDSFRLRLKKAEDDFPLPNLDEDQVVIIDKDCQPIPLKLPAKSK